MVIAVLMVICALLGIPFYVAATVISIMHVDSLKTTTECTAPGEKPEFLGIRLDFFFVWKSCKYKKHFREQRVTALVAHILIGLAVKLTPVIRVRVGVLLGVFFLQGKGGEDGSSLKR